LSHQVSNDPKREKPKK